MVQLTRRIAIYFGSLLTLVVLYTVTYRWGMAILEGELRTWYGALEIVIQSMTTTGYGQDAPWETAQMTVLMVLIQLTGIAYIFVAFPLFVVPWLNTLVQSTAPEDIEDIEDHVVIMGYTELCAALVNELESREIPYVVLEGDSEKAQDLYEDGINVLQSDPTTDEALDAAQVADAFAILIDATENEFISTILAIDERNLDVPVLALIDDQSRSRYLRYAGVDKVLSPKHRLGKALGDKVRGVINTDLDSEIDLDDNLRIAEYPIARASEFFAVSLETCRRLEQTGATVLGIWVRGDFVTTMSSDVHTDENTTLLVAGTEDQLSAVADRVGSSGRRYRSTTDPVLVVGSGIIGATVIGGLERAGLETRLVEQQGDTSMDFVGDRTAEETLHEADVVGDPTDEETLHEAGIGDVRTVVIALDDDNDAILATLVAQELNPEAQILAAIGRKENVSRLQAAGVDYALALPNVAGRMVTLHLFEGGVMTFDEHIQLVRVDLSPLTDEQLHSERIREQTGYAVVALERAGEFHTDIEDWVVERDDSIIIAGADQEVEQLEQQLYNLTA